MYMDTVLSSANSGVRKADRGLPPVTLEAYPFSLDFPF